MPEIEIIGNFDRFEIVKKVVSEFIEHEKRLTNRNPRELEDQVIRKTLILRC